VIWEPSRVTESSYRNVMAEWPYRGSLDCVVEAPDGRFASYVLVRPDDENGVGLFEPVGTRAEFRRRGLGAAVCTFGLRRLHEEGMSTRRRRLRHRACVRALRVARLPPELDDHVVCAMNPLRRRA
jgi:GNAT superfamily N-acetyltransferase